MNDAAIWFALIALAVTGWGYAFALAMALKKARSDYDRVIDGWNNTVNDSLHKHFEVQDLQAQLAKARKNDNRDAKGRYAKIEDICVEPALTYIRKAGANS